MLKNFFKVFLLSFVLFLPIMANAAGIQASPAKLEVSLKGNSVQTEITASNPTADVQVFEVFADDFSKSITASPASFTLEAGERKVIKLKIEAKGFNSQSTASTFISVVATPLAEGNLQARSGVKIPLTISIENKTWYNQIPLWVYGLVALAVIMALTFYAGTKFRKKPEAK